MYNVTSRAISIKQISIQFLSFLSYTGEDLGKSG